MPTRKKESGEYENIKNELAEIKNMLAKRQHIDEEFHTLKQDYNAQMNGNGKPGLKSIRDKVLSWEGKINAIILLVLGDVVMRVWALLS